MRRKSDLHQPKPLAGRVVSALISPSPPSTQTRVFPQIASTPPHTLSPLTHHPPHSLIILLACAQPKKTFAFFRRTAPGKKTVFDSLLFFNCASLSGNGELVFFPRPMGKLEGSRGVCWEGEEKYRPVCLCRSNTCYPIVTSKQC